MNPPIVVIVMGVSGVGKTTIGQALAKRTGAEFIDADAFHDDACVAKMSRGEPLTDDDRAGWLDRLRNEVRRRIDARSPMVLACSALKRRYRQVLRRDGEPVLFVHLEADAGVIRQRLTDRQGHFMPETLLASQVATLERPDPGEDAVIVRAEGRPGEIVGRILDAARDGGRPLDPGGEG